jgi:hypothetical protein
MSKAPLSAAELARYSRKDTYAARNSQPMRLRYVLKAVGDPKISLSGLNGRSVPVVAGRFDLGRTVRRILF